MSHEFESGFARKPMWHGLGVVSGEALRAEDAIRAAGLEWTVEKRPLLFVGDDGQTHQIPDRYATVRSTDETVLGLVGPDFVPLQNTEAFEVLDDLLAEGELTFDSAGSLRNGRVVFASARLPETVPVAAGSDAAELFIVLGHGHDGTRAIRASVTPILPVCMNTLTYGESVAKSQLVVQHRSNARARLREAGKLLGVVHEYADTLSRVSDELAATEMELEASKRFLTELYSTGPCSTDAVRAKHLDGTLTTLEKSDRIREDTRYTAWGVFNAVTEWWDWRRPQRESDTAETRLRSTWEGAGKHYRERGLKLLMTR